MTDINIADAATEACQLCDKGVATAAEQIEYFPYGDGDEAVMLRATIPVWLCAGCGGTYHGEDAEKLMHNAVCDHLGRLRPSEIKAMRFKRGLNAEAFGEETGISVASIKRWESGAQIQTKAFDNLLRYYSRGPLPQELRTFGEPVFRTNVDKRRDAAQHFILAVAAS